MIGPRFCLLSVHTQDVFRSLKYFILHAILFPPLKNSVLIVWNCYPDLSNEKIGGVVK